jgi:hypothetical protein
MIYTWALKLEDALDNLVRVFFKTALQLAKMMNADGAKLL